MSSGDFKTCDWTADLVIFEDVTVIPRDALLLGKRLDLLLFRNNHGHQKALQCSNESEMSSSVTTCET